MRCRRLHPNPIVYKSALAILQSSDEGGRCNFKGVVVVCEDYHRAVQFAEGSPRKRKSMSLEGKAADVILVDRIGPVSACLWGNSAEAICNYRRQSQERRSRGDFAPCVVDLSKVRIQGAARSNWNGESLTHIRTLTSVESISNGGRSMVKSLPIPTS